MRSPYPDWMFLAVGIGRREIVDAAIQPAPRISRWHRGLGNAADQRGGGRERGLASGAGPRPARPARRSTPADTLRGREDPGNDIGGTESASQHGWRQMARPVPARRVDSASRTRMQTGTIEEQDDHAEGAGYDPRLLLQALEQDFS